MTEHSVHPPDRPLRGKAATQERILVAATELFLSQGYEGTTVAEVGERAGVARATVFWHFSDKASLFREAFNRLLEPIRASLAQDYVEQTPAKELEQRVAVYDRFVGEHREAIIGFVRWAMEETDTRDWLIATLLDLHQRFVGGLTETVVRLAPAAEDPKGLALGLAVALDGALFLSFFDASMERATDRLAAVAALVVEIQRAGQP
ncbi:MAG: TetR/AcrR family transcriptional regulator [Deltaproteobacteria bacterium]|nr:TetR/AcrR family transcriptional regulator [Deltaproteobacteria bacterium]